MLPSPPFIDDGNSWMSVHPSEAANAAISSQIPWCTIALRMMPRFGMLSRRLELRLDQRQQVHRGRRQRQRHRQHQFERNEADIDHDDIRSHRQPLALETANVGLFHRNDFRVSMQRRMQLAMPDVDGKHQAGAVGEQHLGKTAGGCADVEADVILDFDRILLQRAGQLDAAARHEGMRRLRLQHRIDRNAFGRFRDRPSVSRDKARFNRGLRAGAAFEQAALDQQYIRALARGGL